MSEPEDGPLCADEEPEEPAVPPGPPRLRTWDRRRPYCRVRQAGPPEEYRRRQARVGCRTELRGWAGRTCMERSALGAGPSDRGRPPGRWC